MASCRDYLDYILEQLSLLEDITYRPMMSEYIIYYRGKIVGGIYDDRFLLKPTPSALELCEEKIMEKPYEGAKKMLVAENVDDKEYLRKLLEAIYAELPKKK